MKKQEARSQEPEEHRMQNTEHRILRRIPLAPPNNLVTVEDMAHPRTAAQSFRDLVAWQKAHQFVLAVYALTAGFPKQETYGLSSQLRRAAVSIPANIAEGFRRRGRRDKGRFLNIAQASLEECRYYLILAQDLRYGETAELSGRADEISRVLSTYTAAILNSAF